MVGVGAWFATCPWGLGRVLGVPGKKFICLQTGGSFWALVFFGAPGGGDGLGGGVPRVYLVPRGPKGPRFFGAGTPNVSIGWGGF